MKFSFTYIDFDGIKNTETCDYNDQYFWNSIWDAERIGEIRILLIQGTVDNWDTSFDIYEAE